MADKSNQFSHIEVDKLTQIANVEGGVYQNIVIVSRFLDFVGAEDFIPGLAKLADFKDIAPPIEQLFDASQKNRLAVATARVGSMLNNLLMDWTSEYSLKIVNYRELLRKMAPSIIPKLIEYGYWDIYQEFESVTLKWRSGLESSNGVYQAEVIWLSSLECLWEKHLREKKLFGLALIENRRHFSMSVPEHIFVVKSKGQIVGAYEAASYRQDRNSHFGVINDDDFRIFISGLVIDLLSLATNAHNQDRFVANLSSTLLNFND